jgi:outer membrane protein assembly factor BamB
MKAFYLFLCLAVFSGLAIAQPVWQKNLDSKIEFYQTTDFGLLIVGTEKSLYAVDGQSGDVVWRRKHAGLDETSILPVPATDLILVSLDQGDKSRLEAIDVISGDTIWRSDKVKGDVMQLAVEPAKDLLCVVMAKKARGKSDRNLKRKPVTHALRLSNGKEIWKRELDSDIEMMPAEFAEDKEVNFTLDNYRAPLIVDDRVYLFYEGATILNASNGKELERDKFKVNEGGLALTEADPVLDEKFMYVSGRGRVRAIDRQSGKTVWKADDLGVTSEMYLVGQRLFVKTGGQFTRLKDGETEEKGPFGITAIDTKNGKTIWRYKGADKGITNFVFRDASTIILADRDDLILLNADNGKRIAKTDHKIEKAQFVMMNERGEAVVGGHEEIAGFGQAVGRPRVSSGTQSDLSSLWTAKHKAPGRGVFRIMAAIALRATALYFRYGGLATSAFSFATIRH